MGVYVYKLAVPVTYNTTPGLHIQQRWNTQHVTLPNPFVLHWTVNDSGVIAAVPPEIAQSVMAAPPQPTPDPLTEPVTRTSTRRDLEYTDTTVQEDAVAPMAQRARRQVSRTFSFHGLYSFENGLGRTPKFRDYLHLTSYTGDDIVVRIVDHNKAVVTFRGKVSVPYPSASNATPKRLTARDVCAGVEGCARFSEGVRKKTDGNGPPRTRSCNRGRRASCLPPPPPPPVGAASRRDRRGVFRGKM